MNIFRHEFTKLAVSPAVLVFIGLCLAFNILIMASDAYYDYSDYVAKASRITGYRLGADFEAKISALTPGEERDYFETDTTDVTDVFDGYTTAYIAESYTKVLKLTGITAELMADKYAKLQAAVDKIDASDESLTLYFASATYSKHNALYGTTMKFLLLECSLLAALIMFLSLGYEHGNRTSHIVYATKTGRKIVYHKLFASMAAGLTAYAILTALTLSVYFALNDYGSVWHSSVSSGFNYINDILADSRPFATWHSYTILTYLLAVVGVAALVTPCFALIAFCIGIWVKNSYIGFFVFLIFNAALVALAIALPTGITKYTLVLSPVCLWVKQGAWFTDGCADILWKNFETLGVCVSLILLAGLCVFSAIMFKRRDIA